MADLIGVLEGKAEGRAWATYNTHNVLVTIENGATLRAPATPEVLVVEHVQVPMMGRRDVIHGRYPDTDTGNWDASRHAAQLVRQAGGTPTPWGPASLVVWRR